MTFCARSSFLLVIFSSISYLSDKRILYLNSHIILLSASDCKKKLQTMPTMQKLAVIFPKELQILYADDARTLAPFSADRPPLDGLSPPSNERKGVQMKWLIPATIS